MAARVLPLATRRVQLMYPIVAMSTNEGFLAVADDRQAHVYNIQDVSPQQDIRRQPLMFSTKTISIPNGQNIPFRIKTVLLTGDYLWVALVNGAVKIWHWPSGEYVCSIRRVRDRLVENLQCIRDEVLVSWNNNSVSIYGMTPRRTLFLKETVQNSPVFQELTIIDGRFALGFNSKLLSIAPIVPNLGYRQIKSAFYNSSNKFSAVTAAYFNNELHVYTAVCLPNNNVVLSHFKPHRVPVVPDMLPLQHSECVKNQYTITTRGEYMCVKTMTLFRHMLMVGVSLKPDAHTEVAVPGPSIQFWCPEQLVCLRVVSEPMFQLTGALVFNRGAPQETLMMVCQRNNNLVYTRFLTARWSFFRENVLTTVLAVKRRQFRFPYELWQEFLTFL